MEAELTGLKNMISTLSQIQSKRASWQGAGRALCPVTGSACRRDNLTGGGARSLQVYEAQPLPLQIQETRPQGRRQICRMSLSQEAASDLDSQWHVVTVSPEQGPQALRGESRGEVPEPKSPQVQGEGRGPSPGGPRSVRVTETHETGSDIYCGPARTALRPSGFPRGTPAA